MRLQIPSDGSHLRLLQAALVEAAAAQPRRLRGLRLLQGRNHRQDGSMRPGEHRGLKRGQDRFVYLCFIYVYLYAYLSNLVFYFSLCISLCVILFVSFNLCISICEFLFVYFYLCIPICVFLSAYFNFCNCFCVFVFARLDMLFQLDGQCACKPAVGGDPDAETARRSAGGGSGRMMIS